MEQQAVVFCVTGPHIQLTAVAITTLLQHYHQQTPLKILVVCDHVLQADIDLIRSFPQQLNRPSASIDFWAPPAWAKDLKPYQMRGRTGSTPPMAFWRMFLPAYFSNYQKLLYLDNDIIVNTDVSKLFDRLDDQHTLAAVPDFLFAASKDYELPSKVDTMYLYGMADMQHYFNGGVIVMNVARYNASYQPGDILKLIQTTSWNLADQTLMNLMFQESTSLLPYRYNYQHSKKYFTDPYHWDPERIQPMLAAYPHIAIRHYAGEGPVSAPYQHVALHDEWEAAFWQALHQVRLLASKASQL